MIDYSIFTFSKAQHLKIFLDLNNLNHYYLQCTNIIVPYLFINHTKNVEHISLRGGKSCVLIMV